MRFLKPFWSILFSHGLIFLGFAVVFLVYEETNIASQFVTLGIMLLLAAAIQVIIIWQKVRSGLSWWAPALVGLVDAILGGLILYAPEQSLQIYVVILAIWLASMGLILLYQASKDHTFKAALIVAGISFLLLCGYVTSYIVRPDEFNAYLLGGIGLIFSIFLIYGSLQLRFQKDKSRKLENANLENVQTTDADKSTDSKY